MPALGNSEAGEHMRYVRPRIEVILRPLHGFSSHDLGPLQFPNFDQGIGQESTKYDARIGSPPRPPRIKLGTFERKALFVYLDRLSVSTGFVEHDPDLVQRRKQESGLADPLRYVVCSPGGLHCTIVLPNSPQSERELTIDGRIAYWIVRGVVQLPRLAQHVGNLPMLAKGLQRNDDDQAEINFSPGFRSRFRPMRQGLQPPMVNPDRILVGAAPHRTPAAT